MSPSPSMITDADLTAFLDEMLTVELATEIEQRLRADAGLRAQLSALVRLRDQGGRAVGEVWRRRRLSCPTRVELGTYLLGVAEPEYADYLDFHLTIIGCSACQANIEDLQSAADHLEQAAKQASARQRRYFQSSAGLLRQERTNPTIRD